VVGGGEQGGAALGFVGGQAHGDEVEAGVWEPDPAAGGELEDQAGGGGRGPLMTTLVAVAPGWLP
jgi:hypothetical protein